MACIWQYFSTSAYNEAKGREDKRTINFTRRSMNPAKAPKWERETGPLAEVKFSHLPIEDIPGPVLEVDFANKNIGGGVLSHGSVQEEIMMAQSPEMIVARLFTTPLEDNEVLFINGTKRYSQTSGYSDTFKFEGPYRGTNQERYVVAMDAKEYRDPEKQYDKMEIDRELNKAYSAFAIGTEKIATGHWGCGVFRGDKELKALIQLLAASKAKKEIIFCMPGRSFQEDFTAVIKFLKKEKTPPGKIYNALVKYKPGPGRGSSFPA